MKILLFPGVSPVLQGESHLHIPARGRSWGGRFWGAVLLLAVSAGPLLCPWDLQ